MKSTIQLRQAAVNMVLLSSGMSNLHTEVILVSTIQTETLTVTTMKYKHTDNETYDKDKNTITVNHFKNCVKTYNTTVHADNKLVNNVCLDKYWHIMYIQVFKWLGKCVELRGGYAEKSRMKKNHITSPSYHGQELLVHSSLQHDVYTNNTQWYWK